MSYKTLLKNQVSKAINNYLGDLSETFIYTKKGVPTYNATTGETVSVDVDYTIKGLFGKYNKEELSNPTQGEILPGDIKLMIANKDFKFTPKEGDIITRNDKQYSVIMIENSFDALTKLQMREI